MTSSILEARRYNPPFKLGFHNTMALGLVVVPHGGPIGVNKYNGYRHSSGDFLLLPPLCLRVVNSGCSSRLYLADSVPALDSAAAVSGHH